MVTNHLDEGVLHSLLDGELDPSEAVRAREHLDGCPECRARMEEAHTLLGEVQAGLDLLDTPEGASHHRWEVRRRWARSRSQERRRSFAAAAVLLLVLAGGVASAHPASPLRGWVASVWDGDRGAEEIREPAPADLTSPAERSGVEVELREGSGVVELSSVPPGTEVRVRVMPGDRLGLHVSGDARFSTGPGRVTGEEPGGPVEVTLPEGARQAELLVNGEVWARWSGEGLDLPGAAPLESDSLEARFRVPEEGGL